MGHLTDASTILLYLYVNRYAVLSYQAVRVTWRFMCCRQTERCGYPIPNTEGAREEEETTDNVPNKWCQEAHAQLQPDQLFDTSFWSQD